MRMKRLIIAVAAVASTTMTAGLVLDACATGGIVIEPEAGSDVTVPPGDAGCKTGFTDCNGTCVNMASDPKNCGKCGTACTDGGVCSQSACAQSCGGGTTKCGSSCVNVQTDPQNCGKCATACAGNDFCDGGACIPSCTSAQKVCGSDGGLFCATIQTDNQNCGDCNVACTNGWTCQQGKCLPNCTTGQTLCDIDGGTQNDGGPFCTNTKIDPNNCGQCDKACTSAQYCDAGGCVTNPVPVTCKTVNGVLWCYHAGTCGEGCNAVCTANGKTAVTDAGAIQAAQSTQQLCQNIATAFGNASTPSVSAYSYACVEVQGSGDGGAVSGQIYCSTDSLCPTSHLTTSDSQNVACNGTTPFTGICACK